VTDDDPETIALPESIYPLFYSDIAARHVREFLKRGNDEVAKRGEAVFRQP
jgi:hypothetical protein